MHPSRLQQISFFFNERAIYWKPLLKVVEDGGIRLSGPNSDLNILIIGPVHTHLDLQNQTTYWSDVVWKGRVPKQQVHFLKQLRLPTYRCCKWFLWNSKHFKNNFWQYVLILDMGLKPPCLAKRIPIMHWKTLVFCTSKCFPMESCPQENPVALWKLLDISNGRELGGPVCDDCLSESWVASMSYHIYRYIKIHDILISSIQRYCITYVSMVKT